ncbi:hypothetical protein [Catalinimonas niigatensis]|uniref:hypothetical protein n=1 Tax=Catalinimonas niigatensis TaxID=1397264 RepID=UPI00266521ED|nr:hypothetical protein [Catalinimonas niigatensis]WPP53255.1 hypothetical protein PZB72_12820 [Catalinimonas niigatensis]
MLTIRNLQTILKNLFLAITAFLVIDLLLVDTLLKDTVYNSVFEHALIFGILIGLAAATNEILIERNIHKKAKRKNLLLQKVNLSAAPLHYIRLIRVFIVGSIICLLFITVISFFETDPLSMYAQLSVIPVCLALGANVPQSYTLYISLTENRQNTLRVIQDSLKDSIFEVEFRNKDHFIYKINNKWSHFYAYCFTPDRCTLEMLVCPSHVEISGSYRYLESIMDDQYVEQTIKANQEKEKEKVA